MQELIRSQLKHEIQVFPNPEALTEAAAVEFVRQADRAIQARGRFTIALSGGSTSKSLYTLLVVTGAEKAAMLKSVLEGAYQPDRLPAQIIHLTQGRVLWMVDRAASLLLEA
jgi:6-phosphogluconolactonase